MTAATRTLQPCGTEAAYQRHRRRGEQPCEPCAEARRAKKREWEHTSTPREELQPCGTVAAYCRHQYRKEPIDSACQEAWRIYQRQWRHARRDAAGRPT